MNQGPTADTLAIAKLLEHCEQNGAAPPYGGQIRLESRGRDVVIISDLHMSAGRGLDGNYSGTEDFFADEGFVRFLRSFGGQRERKTVLVINGDFVDFLRITALPDAKDEFESWLAILGRLGITPAGNPPTVEELKRSIDDKEREYGLKTHEYKSVWKLSAVMKGHSEVFAALAEWLAQGNGLVIVKGNHDLEWYWPGVRNYLRLALADRIQVLDPDAAGIEAVLRTRLLPSIQFVDDSVTFDGTFYIEHGHKLDKYTKVVGKPVLPNGVELNIPFGSFLNRYLLNRIELVYPYLDNVRPSQNLLPMLFKKDFGLGLRVLFQHIPFMIKVIPKKYYRYMFRDFLVFLLAVAVPIAVMIVLLVKAAKGGPSLAVPETGLQGALVQRYMQVLGSILMPVLSYFLTRLAAHFKLVEPDYFSKQVREMFLPHPDLRFISLGHTHNPEQFRMNDRWYYNTGTWIPVIEARSDAVREDKTYTFVHLKQSDRGGLQPAVLMRWNDDANRSEPLVLFCAK